MKEKSLEYLQLTSMEMLAKKIDTLTTYCGGVVKILVDKGVIAKKDIDSLNNFIDQKGELK
jgi:hypothetical protein